MIQDYKGEKGIIHSVKLYPDTQHVASAISGIPAGHVCLCVFMYVGVSVSFPTVVHTVTLSVLVVGRLPFHHNSSCFSISGKCCCLLSLTMKLKTENIFKHRVRFSQLKSWCSLAIKPWHQCQSKIRFNENLS